MKTATFLPPKPQQKHSPAKKEFCRRCRSAGMRYHHIGPMIGVNYSIVRRWCDPRAAEAHKANNAKRRRDDPSYLRRYRQHYRQSEHGKAVLRLRQQIDRLTPAGRVSEFVRGQRKRHRRNNVSDFVFIDNQWLEVDKTETYRVFRDILMPKSERDAIAELALMRDRLTAETGIRHEIDHIQPLAKGGDNFAYNLQILPEGENRSKSDNFRAEDQELLAQRLFNL